MARNFQKNGSKVFKLIKRNSTQSNKTPPFKTPGSLGLSPIILHPNCIKAPLLLLIKMTSKLIPCGSAPMSSIQLSKLSQKIGNF